MILADYSPTECAWTFETDTELDGAFGPDRGRKITLKLYRDGRLEMWPRARKQREVVHLKDLFRFAIRCRAQRATLEKARERQAKQKAAKERRAIAYAERKLFAKA